MCLYYETRIHKKPTKGTRRAWKIVKFIDGYYRACFQNTKLDGNWQTADGVTLYTEMEADPYPGGFHSYASKADADQALKIFQSGDWENRTEWVVIPCLVRGVVAVGFDGSAGVETANLRNIVSRQMKLILPKGKK
jgi:hypothetical protein